MAKFCELGVESDVVIGKGIDMEDLFGRRILIEKVIIQPTKFPGKNSSGLRTQMQVVLATFNEEADKDGDFYTNIRRIPTVHPLGKGGLVLPGRTYLLGLFRKPKPICRQ